MSGITEGMDFLSEDVRRTIDEIVEAKKKEWVAEAEERVRREMIERYESDREGLVSKLDALVSEALASELGALREAWRRRLDEEVSRRVAAERAKLAEQVERLRAEAKIVESRGRELIEREKAIARRERALRESVDAFVRRELERELREFARDRRAVVEEKAKLEGERRRVAEATRKALGGALRRIESFVTESLRRELAEFEKDRRALEERRITLERDARRRLAEAKREFVRRAAAVIEKGICESLRREMNELREDILEARRNTLGRRLYEAFVAEWTLSGGSEEGAARSLARRLAEERKARTAFQRALAEHERRAAEAEQRARLAESALARREKMDRLLRPLTGRKRDIMESLLESVETDRLEQAFERFIRRLDGMERGGEPAEAPRPVRLDEQAAVPARAAVEVRTGDRNTGLSVRDDDVELSEIQRLAGIVS